MVNRIMNEEGTNQVDAEETQPSGRRGNATKRTQRKRNQADAEETQPSGLPTTNQPIYQPINNPINSTHNNNTCLLLSRVIVDVVLWLLIMLRDVVVVVVVVVQCCFLLAALSVVISSGSHLLTGRAAWAKYNISENRYYFLIREGSSCVLAAVAAAVRVVSGCCNNLQSDTT